MRSIAACICVCCTLALVACASTQLYEGSPIQAEDKAAMMAALQASADAWNAGNLRSHLAIYDESVTVMTKSGPRPTIAAIEASFSAAYFRDGKPKQNLRME